MVWLKMSRYTCDVCVRSGGQLSVTINGDESRRDGGGGMVESISVLGLLRRFNFTFNN